MAGKRTGACNNRYSLVLTGIHTQGRGTPRFKRLEISGENENRELYLIVFIDLNAITILRYFTGQLLYSTGVIRA